MATGLFLFYRAPFPEQQVFLEIIALRAPHVLTSFKWLYWVSLFSAPYMAYAATLSALYVFTLKVGRRVTAGRLPTYPDPRKRNDLFLVIGEVHNPRKPGPSRTPSWLIVPERGLFTGIAVFGAVGSGKTSSCLYPFAEQILSYDAYNKDTRIGALVLEVKGDFCHRVREILERCGRGEDYVEISLDSEYRYNPLHNDLDAYALAFNIASLLNNLFGRGKEPFWQQAYTNLVKFIILLYKVAFDYVTLFDVYECAIAPDILERKIQDAERRLTERYSLLITASNFLDAAKDLKPFEFKFDEEIGMFRAKETPGLRRILETDDIEFEYLSESETESPNSEKRQQLEAVRRWFFHDWRRIEPKLRTSIVEGISVFLSLFDDNPAVKRTFCPPPECYDPIANRDGRYGTPLPPFSELIEQGKVVALNFPVSANPGLAKTI